MGGLAAYEPEWPAPLSKCPGYVPPAGIPITLELGRWLVANVSDYSVKTENQVLVESCVFNVEHHEAAEKALGK